jgi:hypothetical protein
MSHHPDLGIHNITAKKSSNHKDDIKARELHEKGNNYTKTFLNQSNTILIARGLMLRGLVDPDDDGMHPNHNDNDDSNQEINEKEGIRKMIYKFFDEHYGLSKNPYSRLETLMTDLYNVHENSNQKWLVLIFFCINILIIIII